MNKWAHPRSWGLWAGITIKATVWWQIKFSRSQRTHFPDISKVVFYSNSRGPQRVRVWISQHKRRNMIPKDRPRTTASPKGENMANSTTCDTHLQSYSDAKAVGLVWQYGSISLQSKHPRLVAFCKICMKCVDAQMKPGLNRLTVFTETPPVSWAGGSSNPVHPDWWYRRYERCNAIVTTGTNSNHASTKF